MKVRDLGDNLLERKMTYQYEQYAELFLFTVCRVSKTHQYKKS